MADTTVIVLDDLFLEHHNQEGHPERPERLTAISAVVREAGWFPRLRTLVPRPATERELLRVHTAAHLELIRATDGVPFTFLDMDTQTSDRSYRVALQAAGALCVATEAVWRRDAANAFALIRPPGHHAERDRAMGFCLFNNIAVAAAYAREDLGARRVLIVDWDVHHGNGTQHIFQDDSTVLYFSTHQYPHYPGTGAFEEVGSGDGVTVNVPLPAGRSDRDYAAVYKALLVPVARAFQPDLILVSAGFDIHERDPLAGMGVTASGCAALARLCIDLAEELCRGRLVLTLEGGYDLEGLSRSVGAVLTEMMGETTTRMTGDPDQTTSAVIDRVRSIHGRWFG